MENYKALAIQYLKLNKRRTILTILGTACTVLVLYIILNAGFSYLDVIREKVRETGDYEMVFYTETKEQIQAILDDPVVERAYVGSWYLAHEKRELEQALFVTGTSPYRINKNFEYIRETYGIEGTINSSLAAFYLQGSEGNIIYIIILFFLLISYIFAIFGVGVIRNSIQLSLFEQIKDYGNLRCIGASIGQLRAIIYCQGAIMELSGMAIGIFGGQIILWIVGVFIDFPLGVHLIPIILILIAYCGDLYFAMEENCKLVTGMTPISALKGEFRIKKEKIKVRKKSIYGKLFGVDGDYAYKNLMRSPGRFYKSVGAMFLGITALVACLGIIQMFAAGAEDVNKRYGYYQIYYKVPKNLHQSMDEVQKNLPTKERLQTIAEIDAITKVKKAYESEILMVDENALYEHLDDTYLNEAMVGDMYRSFHEQLESGEEDKEGQNEMRQYRISTIELHGYDEEDYARYEEDLLEGTLDVSENGIVVVNGTTTYREDEESLGLIYFDTAITTYQLGDTIEIVNPDRLNALVSERLEAQKAKLPEGEELEMTVKSKTIMEAKKELIAQGESTSYVIEGILKRDTNQENMRFTVVVPLERYFAITGMTESDVTGMNYHVDTEQRISIFEEQAFYFVEDDKYYEESMYPEEIYLMNQMTDSAKYVLAFILFVATISSVNIINTTASNLRMRRKEFAQLRVIGVSKNRLIKMVLLEGVIMAVVANVLGITIGILFGYGAEYYIGMIMGYKYQIPWIGIVLGLILSVAVLCGSEYVPMKQMKQDLASDLAASGE